MNIKAQKEEVMATKSINLIIFAKLIIIIVITHHDLYRIIDVKALVASYQAPSAGTKKKKMIDKSRKSSATCIISLPRLCSTFDSAFHPPSHTASVPPVGSHRRRQGWLPLGRTLFR